MTDGDAAAAGRGAARSDRRTESAAAGEAPTDGAEEPRDEHLANVEDGCGCAEVWEHLSELREADD